MSDINPKAFLDALDRLRRGFYGYSARPPQFFGLSGIGCVCPSEYRDITNRTGPYRKDGPLDLGDDFYTSRAAAEAP